MNELFTPDGHLTDEALQALINGSLDETGRLEVGEHLSYCDRCLARYTDLLTGEVLEEPPKDQTLPVMRRIFRRQSRTALRRYASAAAAVALGSFLWYSGTLDLMGRAMLEQPEKLLTPPVTEEKPFEESPLLKAVEDWSDRFRKATAPAFQAPERSHKTHNMKENPQ